MAYDQSELPHIGPTRREIRKTRREKRKNTNASKDNLHTMLSEGPKFVQKIRGKRASKNVKFTDVIENVRLEQGGGLKPEYAQYATLKNRPILGSTKIEYSVPRQEFKHGPNSKIWKSTRREARAMKLGKAAMAAGIYGMLTAGKK